MNVIVHGHLGQKTEYSETTTGDALALAIFLCTYGEEVSTYPVRDREGTPVTVVAVRRITGTIRNVFELS